MFKNTLKRLNHLKKQRLLLSDSSTVIFLSAVFDSLCDTALSVLLLFLMLIKNCRVHCLILQCCRVCAQAKDISDSVHCKLKQCPSVLDAHNTHFLLFTHQIHRSKNKWKFHLKDGIMNLNGRDYVFSKAIGDAEWWRRKKTEKKKTQTKQQEQELCNSFYPVNRLFNILPYPVTGFISGNFFWVFDNSDKPKGLWGTVQTWVSSITLD